MATRAQKYGQTYVPALRMAIRWEEIQANITDEQDRYRAALEVVARERAELSDLSARLEAEPVSADVLASYLVAIGADTQAAARARAGAARSVTEKQQNLRDIAAKKGTGQASSDLLDEFRTAVASGPRLSPDTVRSAARALGIPDAQQQSLIDANAKRPAAPGTAGPSPRTLEQAALIQLTDPSAAARPAMQGALEARASTPAKSAPALTESQVLKAYTRALAGGTGGDLAGRFIAAVGPLPEKTDPAALLAEAGQLYDRTRTEGSFSREDAKVFNDDWLRTAEALRSAEDTAEQIKPGYTDPAREAARRELAARGLDPDDRYVALKGDRRYDYLTAADRIYSEVDGDVRPATPEQTKIAEFVSFLKRESARTGQPLELKKIERELGKTLKGTALAEGIGFALALARSESERPEDRKTQADLQREAAQSAERLKEIDASRAAARAEQVRIESELEDEIKLLTEQAGEKARLTEALSPNVPGLTPEQGRLRAEAIATPIAPPDYLMDRTAVRRAITAIREGEDPVLQASRLRAMGLGREQVRAIVAAARPELAPAPAPAPRPAPAPAPAPAPVLPGSIPADTGARFQRAMEQGRTRGATPPSGPAPSGTAMPRLSLPPTDIRVPTPTGATAPLPAKKPSDALLDTLEGMDPNSDAYKAGLRQYNTLISQGN